MTDSTFSAYLPDFEFYLQAVKCQYACPVRTDARGYVNAIAKGQYEEAYLIARETNPFASTCGWVCGAPCEAACRRGDLDAPIAIRALKRFVNDKYGVYIDHAGELDQPVEWQAYTAKSPRTPLGNSTLPNSHTQLKAASAAQKATGKRVAVVGSGPAGLTCAHDLALLGHEVTIFEAASSPGGMLRLGVPEYRLPRELIDLEIQAILALGPELKLNRRLGVDFELKDLRKEFDAVFLGIGTYQSRKLNVEGEELDGVLRAVDFLINVNLGGYNLDLGKKVLVIGGGNVAMDVARTAARLGHPAQSGGDLEVALDAARTAKRLGVTEEVHCLVVEAREEMLADSFEVEEALKEGVVIHNHIAPKSILGEGGRANRLETLDVIHAFDEKGRFNPKLAPGSEKIWDCDSVIISIGQMGEFDWIKKGDDIELSGRGTVQVDRQTLATTAEGVYAGGDIAFGPRLVINAVADGQRAAQSIHSYLQNAKPVRSRKGYFTPVPKRTYADVSPIRGYLRWDRQMPASLPADRRIGVDQVELGFDEETARQQGGRCLICSLNPIFDGDLCILCNGCVDVCPTNCLKLVPVSEIDADEHVAAFVARSSNAQSVGSAMLLDPTYCIRCGLCAQRCPTEAVTMESFRFAEEIQFLDEEKVQ